MGAEVCVGAEVTGAEVTGAAVGIVVGAARRVAGRTGAQIPDPVVHPEGGKMDGGEVSRRWQQQCGKGAPVVPMCDCTPHHRHTYHHTRPPPLPL